MEHTSDNIKMQKSNKNIDLKLKKDEKNGTDHEEFETCGNADMNMRWWARYITVTTAQQWISQSDRNTLTTA